MVRWLVVDPASEVHEFLVRETENLLGLFLTSRDHLVAFLLTAGATSVEKQCPHVQKGHASNRVK